MASTTPQQPKPVDNWGLPPILVRMNESFDELLGLNPDIRIEQTASGEVVFMSPTGGESGWRNSRIVAQLVLWSESHGGRVFDSSTLFQLPSGAKRSPDASWVSQARWEQLSSAQRKGFPPLCPDLVVELRSESDRCVDLQAKMQEYIDNGAQLGWLIDPLLKESHLYQPRRTPVILNSPGVLTGDDLMPGFVLDLGRLWMES